MILNIANGSDNFNFQIIGSITQPVFRNGNILWVETDQKITGWEFSVEEPASSVEGAVWFITGISSTTSFNILKKNGITLYPIGAMQYIDNQWRNVNIYMCIENEWIKCSEAMKYLYNEGDECVALTGGWDGKKTQTYLYFGGTTASNNGVTNVATNKTFSCDGYTQLCIEYELLNTHDSWNGHFTFSLLNANASVSFQTRDITLNQKGVAAIDVTTIGEEVKFQTSVYYATVNIYKVYLLP